MDTYRTNVYNITKLTTHVNRLIQGGFRYQQLKLSSPGEIVLAKVGVKPTTSVTPITSLPGSFECSDADITQIWRVGARTIQLNEIPAFTIPSFWDVSSEGSYVNSQAPQVLSGVAAAALMQYELDFEVKPIDKGFSFSVLADTLNSGIYIWVNIANGTISANVGATEKPHELLASAPLPNTIKLGDWHNVKALVNLTDIAVSVDGAEVFKFTQTSSFYGSFGLGAALGHSAMFRNLTAKTLTGTVVYSSQLNNETFLSDFLMGTNPLSTTVDGSKRDRIAYTGDLDIAVSSTMVSTLGSEFIQGTLDLVGSYQMPPGFFVPTAKIQQEPLTEPIQSNITGLIGYSFNVLTAAAGFYQATGDMAMAKEWAPRIVAMLEWTDSQTLASNGLFNISNPAFGGDWNYYDPTQSGVVAKFNMVYAYALQSCMTLLSDAGVDTTKYVSRLDALRTNINKHFWSNDLGAYYVSDAIKTGFGQDSNALAILAGVTGANHTSSQVLKTLTKLSTPSGPLAFSNATVAAGFQKLISPYASAYHLRAAFMIGDGQVAKDLLKTLWKPMADPAGANYTGCFWETLGADGGLGLGPITSLCHAWGAGPTGELSMHVLGVQATKPGYAEWQVAPITMGLEWAQGNVPVPGGQIAVSWNATDDIITRMEVLSPAQTHGLIKLPVSSNCSRIWTLNGKPVNGANGTFAVNGGEKVVLTLN